MDEFKEYLRLPDIEIATEFTSVLEKHDIPFELDDVSTRFQLVTSTVNIESPYILRIKDQDIDRVSKLFESEIDEEVKNIAPDHYLYTFSDKDIFEVIANQNDWTKVEVKLAMQIANERKLDLSAESIKSAKKNLTKTKHIDIKFIKQFIIKNRGDGKTDQEIYNELTNQYSNKRAIASLIAGTATQEGKAKYKLYNNILLCLLGVFIAFQLFTAINLTIQQGLVRNCINYYAYVFLNIFLYYKVSGYNSFSYSLVVGIYTAFLTREILHPQNESSFIFSTLLNGAVIGLSIFIRIKLFPKFSSKYLKKDDNGEYNL